LLVHLAAIDLEAFTELDVCFCDDLLEQRLALEQRQFPHIMSIQIEQIERDQHDLGGSAL
jgi:hypothetical protein